MYYLCDFPCLTQLMALTYPFLLSFPSCEDVTASTPLPTPDCRSRLQVFSFLRPQTSSDLSAPSTGSRNKLGQLQNTPRTHLSFPCLSRSPRPGLHLPLGPQQRSRNGHPCACAPFQHQHMPFPPDSVVRVNFLKTETGCALYQGQMSSPCTWDTIQTSFPRI